ncbi:MAG: LuxR C-terminal-related transcriptional regulator, partial [Mycobacterium sp.]
RRGSALSSSARAETLAQRCGGATTPALLLASQRLPLTRRESEVATLVGRGLSNRAIAEALTLSVRTVESHLYRAMLKTGLTDREQLGALVLRSRLG